jgi:methyl-accepting chemotaxis protein
MKKAIMILPVVAAALSSCGLVNLVKESTEAIQANRCAVIESTDAIQRNHEAVERSNVSIQKNIEAVEKSNAAIEENRRKLEEINKYIENIEKWIPFSSSDDDAE